MARNYVENLWQLIQAVAAEPFADSGDSRIVRDLGHSISDVEVRKFLKPVFCALDHGSEFEHCKGLAMLSDSRGSEQRWAGRVNTDR